MLSIFEFFIKYHYDGAFVDGINHVLKCYKDAYHTNKNEFWDIVLCSYGKMVNDENKMWTVRKKVVNVDSNDGNKVCRLNIKGEVCEAYFKGKKDILYLAEQFEISN